MLESTERLYEETADRLFRARAGVGLSEAQRWDVTRVFRAPGWDEAFPAEKMLPALEVTLADLGIDLRSQENIELDIEQRPKKSPRAFCAPIEVPGRVVLVIQPMGGADDWRALFHEAGHTEHYAHVSADLPVEAKRLGDVSVTEAWATLMEHLLLEPAWLSHRLDFPKPDEFAAEAATGSLYLLRRYCGKLMYELEFHGSAELDPKAMSSRYVEILGDALKIEPSPTDALGDIDSSFYVTGYLRSWALQSQLREHFRERFGSAWFADRKAGGMLRELWSEGHRLNADELLATSPARSSRWSRSRSHCESSCASATEWGRGRPRNPLRAQRRRLDRLPGLRRRPGRPRLRARVRLEHRARLVDPRPRARSSRSSRPSRA